MLNRFESWILLCLAPPVAAESHSGGGGGGGAAGAAGGASAAAKVAPGDPLKELVLITRRCCPFSLRVMLALETKGVPFTNLTIGSGPKTPAWFKALAGEDAGVPVLAKKVGDGEGDFMFAFEGSGDSNATLALLEKQVPEPALCPADKCAVIDEWKPFALTELQPACAKTMMASAFPMQKQFRAKLTAALEKLDAGLRKHSGGGQFFFGAAPTLLDILLSVFLQRVPFLDYFRDYRYDSEKLSEAHRYITHLRDWPAFAKHAYSDDDIHGFYVERIPKLPPLSITRLQHAALRNMQKDLKGRAAAVAANPDDDGALAAFVELWEVYATLMEQHSIMEDTVVYPRLEKIKAGATSPHTAEHSHEGKELVDHTEKFRAAKDTAAGSEDRAAAAAMVGDRIGAICEAHEHHFQGEEKNLFPCVLQQNSGPYAQ